MFIPYGTDAPIYHWPKATVGIIVVNVLVFIATASMDSDDRMGFALSRGEGLHPLEWLTSFFMHANIEHLVGNMIFLWAFGIVVEGKLGVLKYLVVYLGMGLTQSIFEQVGSLGAEHGHILGASGVIYGLLAIAMVWAPSNDLNCIWFWRFYPHQIDIGILWFALLYIGLEFLMVAFTGGVMSTPLLHATGALMGLFVGVGMLKAGLVDCENWDLFAVIQGRTGVSKKTADRRKTVSAPRLADEDRPAKVKKSKTKATEASAEDPANAANRRLRRHLDAGDALAAQAAYDKSLRTVAGWQPPDPDWLALIKALVDAKELRPAIAVMEDYLRRAENPSPRVRLKLAQMLIKEQRPAHALRILDGFSRTKLSDALEGTRGQLVAEAQRLRDEGVLELDGEVW